MTVSFMVYYFQLMKTNSENNQKNNYLQSSTFPGVFDTI